MVADGIAVHLREYSVEERILQSDEIPSDVVSVLRETDTKILLCYLPLGSTKAVRFYANAALEAGCAFINCVPVFIANNDFLSKKFHEAGLLLIGDDIRSQVGATILHQRIVELLCERGYIIEDSYQLNFGGNTDFLNMLAKDKLHDKRLSKKSAVESKISQNEVTDNLHIGPSDYVKYFGDKKIAYINIGAKGFCNANLSIELKLQVEDSPNSATVLLDAIRFTAIALNKGIAGTIDPLCSYFMKSPPHRIPVHEARDMLMKMASLTSS